MCLVESKPIGYKCCNSKKIFLACFFCTNEVMFRALWRHLLSFLCQFSIFEDVRDWQPYNFSLLFSFNQILVLYQFLLHVGTSTGYFLKISKINPQPRGPQQEKPICPNRKNSFLQNTKKSLIYKNKLPQKFRATRYTNAGFCKLGATLKVLPGAPWFTWSTCAEFVAHSLLRPWERIDHLIKSHW